jgi:hypothetical protein
VVFIGEGVADSVVVVVFVVVVVVVLAIPMLAVVDLAVFGDRVAAVAVVAVIGLVCVNDGEDDDWFCLSSTVDDDDNA